mmetsp:Transcript_8073/g.14969  ORF Transcript_8073/g.14969 Transcript_8073/m.14969 type:complete len:281 (+) Transcript_8073:126-968(+)|eukprot:CAMPEP_0197529218 /NCGR_PEP_ID=MMETSP1318-20131121/27631_1 /TAXON_ID=552666 /ORGANISM="Partenskyella glossopodia, Strain RCC365" /LENGTH=280 /DNA_ID=CAMNT_0043084601 /DNA_START=76 /DNA_END=918 /DNA_ORIENTATION=+
MLLSASERKFISQGIQQNLRSDGRRRMDHRFFDLKTAVILNANGSARLVLDHTDVLVAVKVEISEPSHSSPSVGRFECSVKCAPSASLHFEGRGADVLNVQLTSGLSALVSDAIDLGALCIVPRQQCWVVCVDAIVLDSSGNLGDALSMATYAALQTTTLASIKVVSGDESNETVIEVSDDPYETTKLPLKNNVPIQVTLTKIGGCFVVDATAEEESCMSCRVSFCISSGGKICSMNKIGIGGISHSVLLDMMKLASVTGKDLIKKLQPNTQPNTKQSTH